MSFIQRRRQPGSWLALILGTAGTSSATSGEDVSDSESHNSHRSTAAELPPTSDTPVLAESCVQTETVNDNPLIVRARKTQKFLRDIVEVEDESWTPKRIKVRDFAHVYQTKAAKLKVPNVSAFDPKIHPVTPDKTHNAQRPAEKTKEGTTETAPVSKQIPKPPATVTPPQSSDPLTRRVPQTALQPPATAIPQKAAKPAPAIASSFFVTAREAAADDFIEDSGFVPGEDEESEQSEDEHPPPPANPFFSSGSLFTGGSAPNPFQQPPSGNSVPAFGGSSLFAPFASASPFASQSPAGNPFLQKTSEPVQTQKLFAFSNPSGSEKNGQKD